MQGGDGAHQGMRIWITEHETLCQGEEAPVLWLCLFWWHCWDRTGVGLCRTVPAQAQAQLSLHCPLTADKPLSCSSSCVNAMSWEAFPS